MLQEVEMEYIKLVHSNLSKLGFTGLQDLGFVQLSPAQIETLGGYRAVSYVMTLLPYFSEKQGGGLGNG
jgi:hypothetical protein